MIIYPGEVSRERGRCRISALIEIETPNKFFSKSQDSKRELWFDWPEEYFSPTSVRSDAFLLVCLTLAMRLKERLKIHGEVSQTLLVNALEAMAIYNHYFPEYCSPVPIEANGIWIKRPESQRVGSFHSGGVDSLYNIAESRRLHQEFGALPVTDLWLVQGMDIPLENETLWKQTKSTIFEQIRPDDNVRCVDIRTNARDIHGNYVAWTKAGFSVVLGAVSKCFAPVVTNALIGSYANYDDVVPHASSPLIDPMWSCDQQTVRHFSCRASRQEKINVIAQKTPHLLAGLRVCYKNPGNAFNCGVCEKCMRTQAQLLVAGHLDKVGTFDEGLTPNSLSHLSLPFDRNAQYSWDFWRDLVLDLREAGQLELVKALEASIRRNKVKRMIARTLRRL
ncbi:hypothetical protein [Ruegeria sp. SCP11]|uniref:hypothetical protein n=1 Tax=Ruegeria sp. SCP11 TaxID=3141378 RepID=UPI00333633A7